MKLETLSCSSMMCGLLFMSAKREAEESEVTIDTRNYVRHAAPSFHAVAAVEAPRRGVPRFGSNAVSRPISGK